tara:strand:- start:325 stop:504 length:180 start_codon:yes stop_codon:yes gene_type:complete
MEEAPQTITNEELEKMYIQTFSEKEKKAYEIASGHLGMSYQTDKSIGFIEWKKKHYPSN